jgi:hypothetical protein
MKLACLLVLLSRSRPRWGGREKGNSQNLSSDIADIQQSATWSYRKAQKGAWLTEGSIEQKKKKQENKKDSQDRRRRRSGLSMQASKEHVHCNFHAAHAPA